MVSLDAIELNAKQRPFEGLPERIMNGEFFMLRHCLQELGLFDTLVNATYRGLDTQIGKEKADKVMALGIDQIHQLVAPDEIPDVTDAVYEFMEPESLGILKKFVQEMLGQTSPFYLERKPNVRFHIPHDVAAPHLKAYNEFTKRRGDGKITPHRAHRDSWVDCPSNLINVWVAVGKVRKGNGLTIYPETYRSPLQHDGPYIASDENPGPASTFDMEPGDVLLFHGDQVHGSEINMTDSTRHVISFRITMEKPNYTNGHHHHYVWSPLSGGLLDIFAEVPQNMSWSFFRYKMVQINRKIKGLLSIEDKTNARKAKLGCKGGKSQKAFIPLTDLKEGAIVPWSKSICVTRLENGDVMAFSRYCPHEGADLAYGVLKEGQVKCPFHNLSIDPATGNSPCQSLKSLKVYGVDIKDGKVKVLEKGVPAKTAEK